MSNQANRLRFRRDHRWTRGDVMHKSATGQLRRCDRTRSSQPLTPGTGGISASRPPHFPGAAVRQVVQPAVAIAHRRRCAQAAAAPLLSRHTSGDASLNGSPSWPIACRPPDQARPTQPAGARLRHQRARMCWAAGRSCVCAVRLADQDQRLIHQASDLRRLDDRCRPTRTSRTAEGRNLTRRLQRAGHSRPGGPRLTSGRRTRGSLLEPHRSQGRPSYRTCWIDRAGKKGDRRSGASRPCPGCSCPHCEPLFRCYAERALFQRRVLEGALDLVGPAWCSGGRSRAAQTSRSTRPTCCPGCCRLCRQHPAAGEDVEHRCDRPFAVVRRDRAGAVVDHPEVPHHGLLDPVRGDRAGLHAALRLDGRDVWNSSPSTRRALRPPPRGRAP